MNTLLHVKGGGFVSRHGLWSDAQIEAAEELIRRVEADAIPSVRIGFVDQHGLVRSKNISAAGLPSALRNGVSFASSLLSKDTSGTTVFSAFDADGGVGSEEMAGAADMVVVADPSTFRVLGWAGNEGWLLGDVYFKTGAPVPFSTRHVFREALEDAKKLGLGFVTGLELEFHLFKVSDPSISTNAPEYQQLNSGNQLLLAQWAEEVHPFMSDVRSQLAGVGVALNTIELEFGPSQLEITLDPGEGICPADDVVLLRTAMKQLAKRWGYHLTFMCRPKLAQSFSSGWHLHQSLVDRGFRDGSGANLMIPEDGAPLSQLGRQFVAGQLRHARAACIFATPTINGYKRFQPYSLAPDRIAWANDNRGAMVRLVGNAEDGNLHIENRVGEPAANPYLYMASQLRAGLLGIEHQLELPPSADNPYTDELERLPASLNEAAYALESDREFQDAMGRQFSEYYLGIKRAEIDRFNRSVTDWEHNEYFDIF